MDLFPVKKDFQPQPLNTMMFRNIKYHDVLRGFTLHPLKFQKILFKTAAIFFTMSTLFLKA